MINAHAATVQSAPNHFLLPNRNLKVGHSPSVLLWRPLWPSGTRGPRQYELFKFLRWRGSACERDGSKLGTTGKQQKRVTSMHSAQSLRLNSSVCFGEAHCERSPEVQSTHGGCKRVSTEVRGQRAGCTWMPEVVKYGISNLTLMGGFPSLSSASTLGRPKWARIKYSFPPCQDANCQISVFASFISNTSHRQSQPQTRVSSQGRT